MPELPEVETIVSDLKKNLIGHKIEGVDFLWGGLIKEMSPDDFNLIVRDKEILDILRRAKNIAIKIEGGVNLLMHMKMTGHLIYTDASWKVDKNGRWIESGHTKSPLTDPLNQSIRAIFNLNKGKILAFSDIRKFAYIRVLNDIELKSFFAQYGPEPFDEEFNIEYLKKLFSAKSVAIKKVLMDQKNIAGIGNIYADEILFAARINPQKPANDLNAQEIYRITDETIKILKNAIKLRGTSTSDFRDLSGEKGGFGNVLAVYRKTNQPCINCGTPINRIVIGGRGTHFCPKCQKND